MNSTDHAEDSTGVVPTRIAIAFVALALVYKMLVVARINVNWDEFYFLSHVYTFRRGQLDQFFQTAYVHLFTWVTNIPGSEVDQIVTARRLMVLLLGVTAALIWKLARTWLAPFPTAIALFAYLTCYPVLLHGGSFRIDSLLAPLTVAIVLALVRCAPGPRRDWVVGILSGLAFAATVKAALVAPLVAALVWLRSPDRSADRSMALRDCATSLFRIGATAAVIAVVLLGLHRLSLAGAQTEGTADFATRVVTRTLLDVPWLPRVDYLVHAFRSQPLPWLLILIGATVAMARRQFALLAMALSLWPLLVYRNAFPYYYVVMLAPACVLAGYAVQWVLESIDRSRFRALTRAFALLVLTGLLINGRAYLLMVAKDEQSTQRTLIAGIHSIFRAPVLYIDRCGMVSSFPKANFFMSTWGMAAYREQGIPVFAAIVRQRKPSFLIENAAALFPDQDGQSGLLPEDFELLTRHYIQYWGPVRVAGGQGVASQDGLVIDVPFPGRYRLWSQSDVLVNGVKRSPGAVIDVPAGGVRVTSIAPRPELVRLLIAAANPPPPEPHPAPIFTGL
ncbi:MAG: glycosyltransferase family 39 protein [Steroidobacteraceae bacterium]